MVLKIR